LGAFCRQGDLTTELTFAHDIQTGPLFIL